MDNLIEKILGSNFVNDNTFEEIVKDYILEKVIGTNFLDYINKLPEEEQIKLLKEYIKKIKNKGNNFDIPNTPYVYPNKPFGNGITFHKDDINRLIPGPNGSYCWGGIAADNNICNLTQESNK